MTKIPFIVLIHESTADIEPIREALCEREGFRVQCLTRPQTALARIAGGGVDAIVVDWSSAGGAELESFQKIRRAFPRLPLVLLYGSACPDPRELGGRLAAAATLAKRECEGELKNLILRLIELYEPDISSVQQTGMASGHHPKTVRQLAILGSKGGVGATTVAFNVACSMAQYRKVILGELRPNRGNLSQYCRPHERIRDLTSLLRLEGGAITSSEVEACLWTYPNAPGLRILFGPQRAYPDCPLDASQGKILAGTLSSLTDQVVIDLPPNLSASNRAVIEASNCLAIVIEREAICLEEATRMLKAILSWGTAPQSIGAVIVNRTALVAPVAIPEFESRLGIPIFSVIPPAPDYCIAAYRANRPLVMFDSESLVTQSLVALADLLSQTAGPLRPVENHNYTFKR